MRKILGIKQDVLAIELGDKWNQQKYPCLEQKTTIETSLFRQISAALKIPVEAIQNFDEEKVVDIFHDGSITNASAAIVEK